MSIQVEHIEKRFNQFAALHDINITFPSGELVALLGALFQLRVGA